MGMLYYNSDALDIAKLIGHHCNGKWKEID